MPISYYNKVFDRSSVKKESFLMLRFSPSSASALSPWLLAAAVLGLSAHAMAGTLAVVNGQSITSEQVDAANPAAAKNPSIAQKTLQTLINRTLLLQQAKKAGLAETPAFQKAMATEKENMLIDAALQQYQSQHPVSEKAIQARYNALVKTAPKQQYRLSEIVVPSYAQAKAILGDLKKGQNFSDLAATHSQASNAVHGGEMGWVNSNEISAPILEALKKVKQNEVIGPISMPSGYVVIQNLGERPAVVLPLKEITPQLKSALTNQETAVYLQKLRKQAHIQIMPTAKSTAVKK
ncbi:peptidylprolyl isomerase [Acidithiobacillus ferrivorans]|uniref:peptidylprolyl isomerase n=1 Tax=Acidithiobacillus ferrivorans TaxID=160808 RepID=UPI0009F2A32B|nr:peptidylprolyl isomerase [Acidithiobacillus ferrivorans]